MNPDVIPPEVAWPVALVLWVFLAVLHRADRRKSR